MALESAQPCGAISGQFKFSEALTYHHSFQELSLKSAVSEYQPGCTG
jgi:hypothetical protein